MKTMTEKYDKTPAQIFFKFLNTQNIIPLSGTKDQTHMIQVRFLVLFLTAVLI